MQEQVTYWVIFLSRTSILVAIRVDGMSLKSNGLTILVSSLSSVMLLYPLGVMGCLSIGMRLFLSYAGFEGLFYFLFATAIPAVGFIRNWIQAIRTAKLYENRFQIVRGEDPSR